MKEISGTDKKMSWDELAEENYALKQAAISSDEEIANLTLQLNGIRMGWEKHLGGTLTQDGIDEIKRLLEDTP